MNIKEFAPVIIPTLNRFEHFKRCIESLERCTWSENTDVYIGLDYPPAEKYVEGWKKIDEYLSNRTFKFNKTIVFRHEKNLGAGGNLRFLKSRIAKNYKCYIGTEDDNEFSPCFLDFMNQSLEKYKDDPNVGSVAGWIPEHWYNKSCGNILFTPLFAAWGYGAWIDKNISQAPSREYVVDILNSWKKSFKLMSFSIDLFTSLFWMIRINRIWGDIMRGAFNVIEHKYQIRPSVSMVRNWGYDGSGINCSKSSKNSIWEKQLILNYCNYELDDLDSSQQDAVIFKSSQLYEQRFKDFPKQIVKLILYVFLKLSNKRFR